MVQFLKPGDNLLLQGMLPIADYPAAIHHHVANRRPVERKDGQRQQIFGRVAGDGYIIQVHGEKVRQPGWDPERMGSMNGGAIKEARGQGLISNLVENGPLLTLEAQMVFELARVFEWIDLRLAVGSERDRDALAHHEVGGDDTVAQISLGGGAGAHGGG